MKFETKTNDEINSGMELTSASVPPGLTSGANLDPSVPVNVQVCTLPNHYAQMDTNYHKNVHLTSFSAVQEFHLKSIQYGN